MHRVHQLPITCIEKMISMVSGKTFHTGDSGTSWKLVTHKHS